jgi:hypothetical protein
MEGASEEVIAEHVLALKNRISEQALVPPPPPPTSLQALVPPPTSFGATATASSVPPPPLPKVQGNYTGPGPSTQTPWAKNNESPVQQSTTHQSPDSLDGSDVWMAWQSECTPQLSVVQNPADEDAWDWEGIMVSDGQKESRDEQKQASDIPRPKNMADIEPLLKQRRTGNVDNAEATGAATPMHDEQD